MLQFHGKWLHSGFKDSYQWSYDKPQNLFGTNAINEQCDSGFKKLIFF